MSQAMQNFRAEKVYAPIIRTAVGGDFEVTESIAMMSGQLLTVTSTNEVHLLLIRRGELEVHQIIAPKRRMIHPRLLEVRT